MHGTSFLDKLFFRKIKNSTRKNRISEKIFLLKKSTRIPRLLSKSERKRATELGESSNLALKFFVDTHGTPSVALCFITTLMALNAAQKCFKLSSNAFCFSINSISARISDLRTALGITEGICGRAGAELGHRIKNPLY